MMIMPIEFVEVNFSINTSAAICRRNKIDEDTYFALFVNLGIILPIITVVGLVGNFLTLIVLRPKKKSSPALYFFLAMAISDLLFVIFMAIIAIPYGYIFYFDLFSVNGYYRQMYPFVFTHCFFLMKSMHIINVWLTVAMSLERYITIVFPFEKIVTKRRCLKIITIIVVVSLIYCIPYYIGVKVGSYPCYRKGVLSQEELLEAGKKTSYKCNKVDYTDFGKSVFFSVYKYHLYAAFFVFLPFSILFLFNVLLTRELRHMIKLRKSLVMGAHSSDEESITLMVVWITIVFLACRVPDLITQFQPLHKMARNNQLILKSIGIDLLTFNSATNIFIYSAVGRKFRKGLLLVFWKITCPRIRTIWQRISIEESTTVGTINIIQSTPIKANEVDTEGNSEPADSCTCVGSEHRGSAVHSLETAL